MGRFEKRFVKQIYKNSGGFLPTWPLGRQVKLGDIIDLNYRRMEYLGTLRDPVLNIEITVGEDTSVDSTKWQSKNGVNIVAKAKGEIPREGSNLPVNKAGITLNFSKAGGFLFQPSGMRINRIENLISVRNEAKEKLFRDLFNLRKIYIITEVGVVDSYALTISESKNSKLEVAVEGQTNLSTKDLADTSLNLEVKTESSLDFNTIGTKGGEIFFKAEKLVLKQDEKEELLIRKPELRNIQEDYLSSFLEKDIINQKGIDKLFDFKSLTMDDLEVLTGDENVD
ncbi:hypothetical protein R5N98_12655 [Tenacibaculum maritimum]|uniref:hypothetical protein n=1 Tax=Tenacibaculum maritimum TaxID=107401 RepID=UPI00388E2194